jgi:hypothetical protein
MFYNVSVAKKAVKIIGDYRFVRNNKEVDYIRVSFDEEWNDIENILAMWSIKGTNLIYPREVVNGVSVIPWEVMTELNKVDLNFMGYDADNEYVRIVSKISDKSFEVDESGYFEEGENPTLPTADALAAYLLEIETKLAIAKESGDFNGDPGKDGTDGTTFIPSIDSEGNLSWSNEDNKSNPATVNIKGPKGDALTYQALTADQKTALMGATFTPSMDEDGVLSWTNDRGLENPQPVNLTGPKGEKGEKVVFVPSVDEKGVISWIMTYQEVEELPAPVNIKGPKGDPGTPGTALTFDSLTDEQKEELRGLRGKPGKNARIQEVKASVDNGSGEPGVTVDLAGTESDRTIAFSFYNLKGDKGDRGDAFVYSDFTEEQLAALQGPKGDKGDKGDPGKDATIFYSASTAVPSALQSNHLYFVYE